MRVIYISKKKTIRLILVVFCVLLSFLYVEGMNDEAVSAFLNPKRELPIYSVQTDEKKISISFDAAWGDEYTNDILDILEERNIKTTFFLVGFWVDKYPGHVRLIAQKGHEVGNHSTTHPHMSQLSKEDIKKEIQTTQEKIETLAGDRAVNLFRPPFGDYNNTLINTCREINIFPIQWDVDSLDWKEYGVEHMFKQVTDNVRNGSIVLFHNNAKYTTQALPGILDHLLAQGYEIVPVSELIYKDNYYINHEGRQVPN